MKKRVFVLIALLITILFGLAFRFLPGVYFEYGWTGSCYLNFVGFPLSAYTIPPANTFCLETYNYFSAIVDLVILFLIWVGVLIWLIKKYHVKITK